MRSRKPTLLTEMTPFPYTIESDTALDQARAMMLEHGVHHLPVTRLGDLIGVVSQREVSIALAVVEGRMTRVEDVAICPAHVVDAHADLRKVVEHMAANHIGCTLVTREAKLVGILTGTDVCRALAKALGPGKGDPGAA